MEKKYQGFRSLALQALDLGVIGQLTLYIDSLSYIVTSNNEVRVITTGWCEPTHLMFEKVMELEEELVMLLYREGRVSDEI